MYASKHGKFWEMHYLLFENQERLSDSLLLELADQLGLSSSDLSVALEKNIYRPRVRTDFDSGIRSGVNGTPTLFINDERYDGLLGFDSVVDRIAHVLAASKV
jgi:protein-disulfide isomerase